MQPESLTAKTTEFLADLLLRHSAHVDLLKRQFRRRCYDLLNFAFFFNDGCAESFVPVNQLIKRLLQCIDVQLTFQVNRQPDVVYSTAALKLIEKPQALLSKRYGENIMLLTGHRSIIHD